MIRIIITISLLFSYLNVAAVEKKISLNADVAKNTWYKVQLSNMHQGTLLEVKASADGLVDSLIVNQIDYKKFPKIKQPLIYSKKLEKHEFSVKIPASGQYYLIIVNQYGDKAKHISLNVKASLNDQQLTRIKTSKQKISEIEDKISSINTSLQKVFIFDDIKFRIAKCGKENLFSSKGTVILCAEFLQKIQKRVSDKSDIKEVMLFAIIHEVSHILLEQWKYPFFNNEEIVDELSSVLLKMTNNSKAIKTTADFFQTAEMEKEFDKKKRINDRHPLSVQRARNLLAWNEDASLINKWQPILVPRIKTDYLEYLNKSQSVWFDKAVMKNTLKLRKPDM